MTLSLKAVTLGFYGFLRFIFIAKMTGSDMCIFRVDIMQMNLFLIIEEMIGTKGKLNQKSIRVKFCTILGDANIFLDKKYK